MNEIMWTVFIASMVGAMVGYLMMAACMMAVRWKQERERKAYYTKLCSRGIVSTSQATKDLRDQGRALGLKIKEPSEGGTG